MNNTNDIQYPFGNKCFIGIIKFFDKGKRFGYIASNNYGMESDKRFRSSEQGFYINGNSWETLVAEKNAVVFQPVIVNGKTQAMKVRAVDLECDRELVMEYYEQNNIITFEEKVKFFSRRPYRPRHFEGYKTVTKAYAISTICGIFRYQIIEDFTQKFLASNDFAELCLQFDKLVNSVGGEKAYNGQIRRTHENGEKERFALKALFGKMNDGQLERLVKKHPSVQALIPDVVMLKLLDIIDAEWGTSECIQNTLLERQKEFELRETVNVIESGFGGLKRQDIEHIRSKYRDQLNEDQTNLINRKLDELILSGLESIIQSINSISILELIRKTNKLSRDCELLTGTARATFNRNMLETYLRKLRDAIEFASQLPWNDSTKQDLLDCIKERVTLFACVEDVKPNLMNLIIGDLETTFFINDAKDLYVPGFKSYFDKFKDLFGDKSLGEIMLCVQEKCIKNSNFINIAKWYSFRDTKMPFSLRRRFLGMQTDELLANIWTLRLFEDKEGILLTELFEKLKSSLDHIFYCPLIVNEFFSVEHSKNLYVIETILALYNRDFVYDILRTLKKEDRMVLFEKFQFDIIAPKELKELLENGSFSIQDYTQLLNTECGREAVVLMLSEMDCSTSKGIGDAIEQISKCVGEEPSDTNSEEHRFWLNNKNLFVNKISTSTNEYLKVIVWAMYFMSSANSSFLKEMYQFFPTNLQVQVFKKLFQLMATNKVKPSLEWLENVIGLNANNLSLPIMIAIKYLNLKKENIDSCMTDSLMLSLLDKREDGLEWSMIDHFLTPCNGRRERCNDESGENDSYRHFSGYIQNCEVDGKEAFRLTLTRKQVTIDGSETKYNNKLFERIQEFISIGFSDGTYKKYSSESNFIYDFNKEAEVDLRAMAEVYRIKMIDVRYACHYKTDTSSIKFCCDCRMAKKLDDNSKKPFMWCSNHPCFCTPVHFHSSSEWEHYTILDFMRILSIPTEYKNQQGGVTRYGQYMIFSSYMQHFSEFFEHLKCRCCGKLMEPKGLSNFAQTSVTEFYCAHEGCENEGKVVYINKCFNKYCNRVIDSRDSKECPNGSYICSKCGACCSNRKYRERYERLGRTGGYVSQELLNLLHSNAGHWESGRRFCYRCGRELHDSRQCDCFEEILPANQSVLNCDDLPF